MSRLRDRVWAWLTAKPFTRIEVILVVAMALCLPYIPQHPTIEILGWVIVALALCLASLIGWIAWTQRGRRK